MDSRQHAPLPANPVGDLLRGWRTRRAMSQADLAFEAGISIKHLSYVETGKAAGSRDILLQLASALGLSLRDRNALLEAAARVYGPQPPLTAVRCRQILDGFGQWQGYWAHYLRVAAQAATAP